MQADGRIHASFGQTVARTGRISSDRPNLHNIPVRTELGKQFRRAFVPAEGSTFLVADYDQVELRCIAHLSEDPGLIDALTSGSDVHRTVAAAVYGIAPEQVTHTQREFAKMVSYGLAYGMEAYGLSQRLGVPVEEAAAIMESYFGAFPLVKHYMDQTVAEAKIRGATRTPFGRVRPLPDLHCRNYRLRQAAERQAMNAGIQGLAADIFKLALVRLDRDLEAGQLSSRLVLQVHDEVIVEVSPGEEDEVRRLTESALTGAADLRVPLTISMAHRTELGRREGLTAAAVQRRPCGESLPEQLVLCTPLPAGTGGGASRIHREPTPARSCGCTSHPPQGASPWLTQPAPPSCPPKRWAASTPRATTPPAPSSTTTWRTPISKRRWVTPSSSSTTAT